MSYKKRYPDETRTCTHCGLAITSTNQRSTKRSQNEWLICPGTVIQTFPSFKEWNSSSLTHKLKPNIEHEPIDALTEMVKEVYDKSMENTHG